VTCHERAAQSGDVRREIAAAAQAVARKALAELADAEQEKQLLGKLLGELGALDDDARAALAQDAGGATVCTAFAPDGSLRSQATRALHERLGGDSPVRYARDQSLTCGITLEGGGHRLGGSLADYHEGLEQRLRDRRSALETEPKRQSPGGELAAEFRRRRQHAITAELLDVVSGYEAALSTTAEAA
jgi:hypothetical protein